MKKQELFEKGLIKKNGNMKIAKRNKEKWEKKQKNKKRTLKKGFVGKKPLELKETCLVWAFKKTKPRNKRGRDR